MNNVCGTITIDTNGKTQPNNIGKDLFTFYISKKGIYPLGMDGDKISFKKFCDINIPWEQGLDGFYNGMGCTAWVIANENMEYLHCADLDWNGKKTCK